MIVRVVVLCPTWHDSKMDGSCCVMPDLMRLKNGLTGLELRLNTIWWILKKLISIHALELDWLSFNHFLYAQIKPCISTTFEISKCEIVFYMPNFIFSLAHSIANHFLELWSSFVKTKTQIHCKSCDLRSLNLLPSIVSPNRLSTGVLWLSFF